MTKVYIPSVDTDSPVYHKETTEEKQGPYGKVHRTVTVCGRATSFGGRSVRLPRTWASKFADACRECFPDAPIRVQVHMDER